MVSLHNASLLISISICPFAENIKIRLLQYLYKEEIKIKTLNQRQPDRVIATHSIQVKAYYPTCYVQ